MNPGSVIWLEGVIGAGKSTLADAIGEKTGARVLHEPVESNPYLSRFYEDMKRWSWAMQVHLLMERYALQKLACAEAFAGGSAVLDRGLPGDRVFARMLMRSGHISELEWKTYERAFDIMCADLRPPSVVVFLDVDPRVAYERIRRRGRTCEAGITLEYLQALDAGYRDLLVDIESGRHAWSRGMRVLRWPWNEDYRAVSELTDALARL